MLPNHSRPEVDEAPQQCRPRPLHGRILHSPEASIALQLNVAVRELPPCRPVDRPEAGRVWSVAGLAILTSDGPPRVACRRAAVPCTPRFRISTAARSSSP